jgi:hypothetical protein
LTAGTGYIILLTSRNAALSYFAVYLAAWYVDLKAYRSLADPHALFPSGIYPAIRERMLTVDPSKVLIFCPFQLILCTLYSVKHLHGSHRLVTSAWVSNNVEGSYKRSVSLAMMISLCVIYPLLVSALNDLTLRSGNINGAVSSNIVCC